MEFNFTGSARRERHINLGGAREASASQLADQARKLRLERQAQKQRTGAATKIQAGFRAHRRSLEIRRRWADELAKGSWDWSFGKDWEHRTRLLVFSWPSSTYSSLHANELAIWAQHLPPENQLARNKSLIMLVVKMMLVLLNRFSADLGQFGATYVDTLLQFISSYNSLELQTHFAEKMISWDLYAALHEYMTSLPLKRSAEAGVCLTLSLRPLAIFQDPTEAIAESEHDTHAPLRARALRGLVRCIFTIPTLFPRLLASSITEFVAQTPFEEVSMHILSLGSYVDIATRDNALPSNPVHSPNLLANYLALNSQKVPHLTAKALSAYLEVLTLLQNILSVNNLAKLDKEYTRKQISPSDNPMEIDSDGQDTFLHHSDNSDHLEVDSGFPAKPSLSFDNFPTTTSRYLRLLVSDTNIHTLLLQSTRFASQTRAAFCAYLVATLQAWPSSEGEHVLTAVLYGYDSAKRTPQAAHVPVVGAVVRELWRGYIRSSLLVRRVGNAPFAARNLETRKALTDPSLAGQWPMLLVLIQLYGRALLTMGDDEFFPTDRLQTNGKNPLTLDELVTLSGLLRNLAFILYWQQDLLTNDTQPAFVPGTVVPLAALRDSATRVLQQIHTRDARRKFTPAGHWHMLSQEDVSSFIQSVIVEEREMTGAQETKDLSTVRARHSSLSSRTLAFIGPRLNVLHHIPFVVPFEVRVEIFRQFIRSDIERLNISRDLFAFTKRHRATVRRESIAEDGMAQLNGLAARLKEPVEIVFIDQFGQPEAGIDGGGVFKEFLTSLVRQVFDTDRGLWRANEHQELYPNPHSYARQPEQLEWYTFLGRILGKALYEGILVDVKLASFFLGKWLGQQSYLDDVASLQSLDADLYRGLIQLKNYPGDVENDFALNFTVTDEEFGVTHTTELIPNGADIPVTRDNRLSYIYHVSRYRLSKQIEPQCRAFLHGLSELIEPRWLRVLGREELRVLISGTEAPIDLQDLRSHTVYGGYHEKDMAVTYFWEALEKLDPDSRKAFLRFVTSSPNPPLLGFAELNPQFAIRHAGDDVSRLPTASTCVNLLKLPSYTSTQQCLEKLRYAIHSDAGFDLS
ncbi:HECT-type E3 ubiquitin transferase [Malassezia yamatoensis]|uniref:HECT-type E3 ubiquitin transferase n=1 Tax=Malassezia yamatoensis TaxID=253288 RepID=A0AAJ5YUW9_9BASI|nr:HECT-type E3 ubiquitin transferase [Malassezia yamatoensis]